MKKISNILVIALDFKPMPGGVAEYTHQLLLPLTSQIKKITVLTARMNFKTEVFDKSVPYSVIRIPLPAEPENIFHKIRSLFYYLFQCFRYIKQIRPDVIFINHIESWSIYIFLITRLLRIPYYIMTHGLEVTTIKKNRIFHFKAGLVLKHARKIFSVSSYTAEEIKKLGIRPEKIKVLLAGVDPGFYKPFNRAQVQKVRLKYGLKNKKVLLTIARIVKRKGIDMVIKVLPAVIKKYKNLVYLIGGTGPDLNRIKKMVNKSRLEKQVIFLGFINDQEKVPLLNACDLFIMPSRKLSDGDVEGFGISYLEAMACEQIVIGGRSGGVPEAIDDKRTGFLVDPEDSSEIRDRIISLLGPGQRIKHIKKRARQSVLKKFNWSKIAADFYNTL